MESRQVIDTICAVSGDTELRFGNWRAVINSRGAVVREFGWWDADRFHRVIDGYANQAELNATDGYRSAILAPWSNRIAGGRFEFGGRVLEPGTGSLGEPNALHGLFALTDFSVRQGGDDTATFTCEHPGDERYPWALGLQVTYSLGEGELRVQIRATNLAETMAPVGLGWHPYFVTPQEWKVIIPGKVKILVDDDLIPLTGSQAFETTAQDVVVQGASGVDTAFTNLHDSAATLDAGSYQLRMRANLTEGVKGYGIFHLYTGDFLANRRYESVALEPCQFMTDAFNRPELQRVLAVEAGQSTALEIAIHATPADLREK